MDKDKIIAKFGDDYKSTDNTFIMGSDVRFSAHIAERFKNLNVLETFIGAGLMTISLAKVATHVYSIEVNEHHQEMAKYNVAKAGLSQKVLFVNGDALDPKILNDIPKVDAAFLDPDWAVSGPNHIFRFKNSNTKPPADKLLNTIIEKTENVALLLPPFIDEDEYKDLPNHEREYLYLEKSHELTCLYFGKLRSQKDKTLFYV